ncbi:MAG: hypothetical protein IPN89_00350 [Saprospiraceae bacterium]|nr:hypothetical protein [Saprospiraceae bacterium]
MGYFFAQWPVRLKRMVKHLVYPFHKSSCNEFPPSGVLEWLTDSGFYVSDVIGLPEIHQIVVAIFKWNTRPLNEKEKKLSKAVFGDSIDLSLVRIDSDARLGTTKMALAYVSFHTINYRKQIKKEIFIHELMHVWQYQHFGSIYIARAFKAQRSEEGYDYGGVANLYQVMLRGGSLLEFNFEQQADIIEDYYKINTHPDLAGSMQLSIYRYFAKELYYNTPDFEATFTHSSKE